LWDHTHTLPFVSLVEPLVYLSHTPTCNAHGLSSSKLPSLNTQSLTHLCLPHRQSSQAAGEWTTDITFFLNGEKVVLAADKVHPRMTLSEYLREHTRLTGTKLSCSQGGCGACNVMLTTFKGGTPSFSSVNACLRPIVSLDGCGVTTTEGIGSSKAGLHPVQERIAACNGTQCGFCTPGHVMAMCVGISPRPSAYTALIFC
jgi:xanthine dehydrogenase iron-sulfur cluster and FAD-binding subunit A